MPPSRRLLRKYTCQTTVRLRRESPEFLLRVAAPPCLQGRRRLCRGRLARRPDRHAGLSHFRSVRAGAANYRAGDRRRVSHYPYFNMALRHHTEGHRANRRPTSDWRKPRHATREGGHGSQDELRAGFSACDGNRLLRAGPYCASTRFRASYQQCEVDCGFAARLSEELIAVLAKIPGLKIIGRSSSFLFKGKSDDSRTIGEKLGVATLLEGSVRKQGDRVRIVAELINAEDGLALWSETYDRELKDVFAVQSEIATAVTEQLKIKLLGAPAKSDAAPSNDNLAAYNALQQGTFYFRLGTEEGTRKATEFYGEAIRLDPRYALAYANLSGAWRQLGTTWLGGGAEAKEAFAKARNAAQTALSLAPDLSAAHEALGFVLLTSDLDFAGAEAELRAAEKLAPADAGPKGALCILLGAQGRLAESENVARQALALDPLGVIRYLNLARVLIGGGRYDQAEAALRKAVALQPAAARLHVHLTTIDVLRGNVTDALRNAELDPPGSWRDYALALARLTQSDRAAADAALQKLINENAVTSPFQIAAVYGLRNEPDKMFEWLDRAYAEHDSGLTQLLVTPFILNYRDYPRFATFCQKLKVQVPPPASAAKP